MIPCCDFFNPVLDMEGNEICSPSGGIAGHGDGNCYKAGFGIPETLVWAHSRSGARERVPPQLATN